MAKAKKGNAVKQPVKPLLPAPISVSSPSKPVEDFIHRLQHWKLRGPHSLAVTAPSRKRKRSEDFASIEAGAVEAKPWVGDKLLGSLRPLVARLRRQHSPPPSIDRQARAHLVNPTPTTGIEGKSDVVPLKLKKPAGNDVDFAKDQAFQSSARCQLSDSDLAHLAAGLRSHRLALFEEVKLHHLATSWRSQKRQGAPEPQLPASRQGSDLETFDRKVTTQRSLVTEPSAPKSGIHQVFKAHTEAHKSIFRELRYGKMTLPDFEAAIAQSEDQVRAENGLPVMARAKVEIRPEAQAYDQGQRTAKEDQVTFDVSDMNGGVSLSKAKANGGSQRLVNRRGTPQDPENTQKSAPTIDADVEGADKAKVANANTSATDGTPKKARRRRQKKAEKKAAQEQQKDTQHGQAQPQTVRFPDQQVRSQFAVDKPPRERGISAAKAGALDSSWTAHQKNLDKQLPRSAPGQERPLAQRRKRGAETPARRQAADIAVIDLTKDLPDDGARPLQPVPNDRNQMRAMAGQPQAYETGYDSGVTEQFIPSSGGSVVAQATESLPSHVPDLASLDLGGGPQAHHSSVVQTSGASYGQLHNHSSYRAYDYPFNYQQNAQIPRRSRLSAVPGHYNPAFAFPGVTQPVPLYVPITPQSSSPRHYQTRSVAKAQSMTPSGSERSTPRRSLSPGSRNVAPPREPFPTAAYRLQALQQPRKRSRPQPLLIISDLNGTLILRKPRSKTVFTERPALSGFLAHLFARATPSQDQTQQDDARSAAPKFMIWTSATPQTTTSVTATLLTEQEKANTIAIWARDKLGLNARQYNAKVQVYKKMELVWSDENIQRAHPFHDRGERWSQRNTLLIDDSVLKATSQPFNLINVPALTKDLMLEEKSTFQVPVLGQVAAYIDEASMYEDVSAWARVNPFVVDGRWSEDEAYNFEKHIGQVHVN